VRGRHLTIYGAIAANVAIAITKFVAAAVTGSGAMLSEGIHSTVDTGDGLLVLLGLWLSKRPATPRHPYGHGLEVYFWSMVVAMAIFGAGGGVSIYEGIHHLLHPREVSASWWSYGVLAAAFVFEGSSWLIARRGFAMARGRRGLWEGIQRSKDPTTFIVLLEDSAALIGIVIAAAGVTLAHVLENPMYDAFASLLIGALLVLVAIILGRETWSLLIGESASPELVDDIRRIAAKQPGLLEVKAPRTLHLGPDIVHVDLDVKADPDQSAPEIVAATHQIEEEVRARNPLVRRVSFRFE
jgi:cation diffusion facilitator family transporter